MTLHLIPVDQVAAQAWRNGGGQTRELLAWPRADDWQLRLSVADIDRDGPFSAFPGVQRWFAVLQGAGVELALPGGTATLTRDSTPCAFDGEAAPGCRLVDGPTRDLNLMGARAHGCAGMRLARAGESLAAGPAWRGVFTAGAATLQVGERPAVALPAFSLAWSDDRCEAWCLPTLDAASRAWWLTFEPHAKDTP